MLNINKIVLGTVQLGLDYGINNTVGKPKFEDAIDLLLHAYNSGIRILDTAQVYGKSQKIIGQYHQLYPHQRFNVISKFLNENLVGDGLIDTVNHDISSLNVDYLYGYMFHSFSDYYNSNKQINELLLLKEIGLIKKIGVSIYTNEEFKTVNDDARIDFIQLPFNLLDNSFVKGELISAAKKKRKEVHLRSVFLQGLFFKERDRLPQNLLPLKPYLMQIDEIAARKGMRIEELALNYVGQNDEVDFILMGVDSKEQLDKNLSTIDKTIENSVRNEIDQIKVKETELLNPVNWG
jgi:aryl-alcohol dehydrogenase-like predicted oxidoreductase